MTSAEVKFRIVHVKQENDIQLIAGQGTFNILAVEELFRAITTGAPSAKFGIAFSEGSGGRILRHTGNDANLVADAVRVLRELNVGHYFVIFLSSAFPLQVLNNIKSLSTTVNVQVASGNEISAVVADLTSVSTIVGFTDGHGPGPTEGAQDRSQRRALVRKIGYLEG